MQIEHVTNALVQILHKGRRIVCDPWLTPGAWDGSWYHYPRLQKTPKDLCPVDVLYISHMHPDHFDPVALAEIRKHSPNPTVVICRDWAHRMTPKLERLGYERIVTLGDREWADLGDGLRVQMLGSFVPYIPIDSSLFIEWDGYTILNLNENSPSSPETQERLRREYRGVDVAMLPYSSAGPYPQCFDHLDDAGKDKAKGELIDRRLGTFVDAAKAISARVTIPIAGTYCLGGKNWELSRHLAVPTRDQVRRHFGASPNPSRLVFLQEGAPLTVGRSRMATNSAQRPDDPPLLDHAELLRGAGPYLYDQAFQVPDDRRVDLLPLVQAAHANMWSRQVWSKKRELMPEFNLYIESGGSEYVIRMDSPNMDRHRGAYRAPYLHMSVPYNYLVMLLTGLAQWNHADVGSHLRYRRDPDVHNPWVDYALNYFHV